MLTNELFAFLPECFGGVWVECIRANASVSDADRRIIRNDLADVAERRYSSGPRSLDLLRALVRVTNVASAPDWPQSAKRLVDILILGSRPPT
jgi:hypothetical protein